MSKEEEVEVKPLHDVRIPASLLMLGHVLSDAEFRLLLMAALSDGYNVDPVKVTNKLAFPFSIEQIAEWMGKSPRDVLIILEKMIKQKLLIQTTYKDGISWDFDLATVDELAGIKFAPEVKPETPEQARAFHEGYTEDDRRKEKKNEKISVPAEPDAPGDVGPAAEFEDPPEDPEGGDPEDAGEVDEAADKEVEKPIRKKVVKTIGTLICCGQEVVVNRWCSNCGKQAAFPVPKNVCPVCKRPKTGRYCPEDGHDFGA